MYLPGECYMPVECKRMKHQSPILLTDICRTPLYIEHSKPSAFRAMLRSVALPCQSSMGGMLLRERVLLGNTSSASQSFRLKIGTIVALKRHCMSMFGNSTVAQLITNFLS